MAPYTKQRDLLDRGPYYDPSSEALFECMREGDVDGLRSILESNDDHRLFPVFFDLEQARNTFVSMAVRCSIFAADAGVSPTEVGFLFRKHMRESREAETLEEVRGAAANAAIEYAQVIRSHKHLATSPLVMRVQQAIVNRIYEEIDVRDIAQQCNLSLSHLEHRFKKESGTTLTQAIHNEKAKRACQLLTEGNLSCAEIATKLNYCSQSYFSKCFKDVVGVTPLEYRNKLGAHFAPRIRAERDASNQ